MYIGETGIRKLPDGETFLSALERAKVLIKSGVDMRIIKAETGWEPGREGRWKYEYPDSFHSSDVIEDHVKRHFGEPVNIALCMKDMALLTAYPDFKRLRLYASYAARGETLGYFSPENYGMVVTIGKYRAAFDQTIEGVLLHEVQHLIQQIEHFAKGTSPSLCGYAKYVRYAGEVESRNVVARHGLSLEERAMKLRTDTQDVPDNRQIVLL